MIASIAVSDRYAPLPYQRFFSSAATIPRSACTSGEVQPGLVSIVRKLRFVVGVRSGGKK